MTATFVIEGAAVPKKTSQRIFRSKRTGKPFVVQSARSVAWEQGAALQLASRWRGRPALSCPVSMAATFYRARRSGDLGNFISALCDAFQVARVIANDKQIVGFDGSRLDLDRARPRVEVTISWDEEQQHEPTRKAG